jgi:hypothetical protein
MPFLCVDMGAACSYFSLAEPCSSDRFGDQGCSLQLRGTYEEAASGVIDKAPVELSMCSASVSRYPGWEFILPNVKVWSS